MSWPADASEWIPQLTIFGLYDADVRALPAAWSLSTELDFYLLVGLVTGRSKTLAVALFALSLPVGVLCSLKVLPFDFYGHPLGNAFAFAFGSVTWFYRGALSFKRWQVAIAACAYALHTYAIPFLVDGGLDDLNLAASLVPFSTMLVHTARNDSRSERMAAWTGLLGRLAYPLFLMHWAAAVLVSHFFFGDRAVNKETRPTLAGALYFLSVFVVALFLSALSFVLVDRPVERVRRILRGTVRPRVSPVSPA